MGVIFFLLYGGSASSNVSGVINTAIFALLVGIYEEFLCRGWLLNEFLERYGETKKGVWISIIASGIIFGLIHFINVSSNGFAGTVTQVLSASATGILFGFIYYRTKNIWACVFLHGFYDFCLMLADINYIKDPAMSGGTIISIFSTVFMIANMLVKSAFPTILQSPINAGAFCMLAGLIIVPVVSLLTKKPDKAQVEEVFSCYNKEVTVTSKHSIGE